MHLRRRQQQGFGGMVAFDVGSLAAARTVLESVKLCTLAESLGGVETLISHPATMTHASVDEAKRQRLGITDGLVRISVGIEDTDDIIADLDQALEKHLSGHNLSVAHYLRSTLKCRTILACNITRELQILQVTVKL